MRVTLAICALACLLAAAAVTANQGDKPDCVSGYTPIITVVAAGTTVPVTLVSAPPTSPVCKNFVLDPVTSNITVKKQKYLNICAALQVQNIGLATGTLKLTSTFSEQKGPSGTNEITLPAGFKGVLSVGCLPLRLEKDEVANFTATASGSPFTFGYNPVDGSGISTISFQRLNIATDDDD